MRIKRGIVVPGVAGLLLLVLSLCWFGRGGTPPYSSLRFRARNGPIQPRFVVLTRGRPKALSYVPGLGGPGIGYVHHIYMRPNSAGAVPVPPLLGEIESDIHRALRWAGIRAQFGIFAESKLPTRTDTALLWVGYRATNNLRSEEVALACRNGSRLGLTPQIGSTEHWTNQWTCWELPSLLTDRGTYRLILPKTHQSLLWFDWN